jgi:hypothetical protein
MLEGRNVIVFPKAWVGDVLEPEITRRLEELSCWLLYRLDLRRTTG